MSSDSEFERFLQEVCTFYMCILLQFAEVCGFLANACMQGYTKTRAVQQVPDLLNR